MSVHVAVDGAVGTLTLDAPPLNLLSDDLRRALLDALSDFRARRLRAVIVTGRGRAFCAGADLRDEAKLTAEQVQAFLDADEAVFTALAEFPGATIAAVNGYAYGGGFELHYDPARLSYQSTDTSKSSLQATRDAVALKDGQQGAIVFARSKEGETTPGNEVFGEVGADEEDRLVFAQPGSGGVGRGRGWASLPATRTRYSAGDSGSSRFSPCVSMRRRSTVERMISMISRMVSTSGPPSS